MDSIVARIQAQPERGNTSGVIRAESSFPSEDLVLGPWGPF